MMVILPFSRFKAIFVTTPPSSPTFNLFLIVRDKGLNPPPPFQKKPNLFVY